MGAHRRATAGPAKADACARRARRRLPAYAPPDRRHLPESARPTHRPFPASAALALALTTAACAGESAAEPARCGTEAGPRHTLVFWDLSDSVRGDRSTHRELAASLRGLVDDALRCPGDRIAGFLVHARTRGKAYSVEARNELAPPRTRGSRNEVTRDSLRYAMELQALRDSAWRRFRALIDSTSVPPRLSRRTDLLGTVEVIGEELADSPADAVARVHYFGDMYESMTGPGRRDFDRDPPRGRAQAEAWARADAELVRRRMRVDPDRFDDVEVRVLLEGHGNRPAADAVKFYWLTLFEELGFSPERVRYN